MPLDIAGYNYIDRLYGTNTYAPERARFPHRLCLGTETSIRHPLLAGRARPRLRDRRIHLDRH